MTDLQYQELLKRLDRFESILTNKAAKPTKSVVAAKIEEAVEEKPRWTATQKCPECGLKLRRKQGVPYCLQCELAF